VFGSALYPSAIYPSGFRVNLLAAGWLLIDFEVQYVEFEKF
jgi:hypothetical protein